MVSKEINLQRRRKRLHERRKRPPPEKYDPDKRSHWSITVTLAWIIWREIDAVRNEWDGYRERVCRLAIRDRRHRPRKGRRRRNEEQIERPNCAK